MLGLSIFDISQFLGLCEEDDCWVVFIGWCVLAEGTRELVSEGKWTG
jgi:hypothetical protein